jgi:hypothetical protein
MNVKAEADAGKTLQELARPGVSLCPYPGGLQPTTVGGEAALRYSCTYPKTSNNPAGEQTQVYVTVHRNVAYDVFFYSAIDDYASATADFDAIMQSWKWSN